MTLQEIYGLRMGCWSKLLAGHARVLIERLSFAVLIIVCNIWHKFNSKQQRISFLKYVVSDAYSSEVKTFKVAFPT